MKTHDLNTMTLKQLTDLYQRINDQLPKTEAREKKSLLDKMTAMAASAGMTLADVLHGDKPAKRTYHRKTKSDTNVKYVNPDCPEQTWSGRGRRPNWFREALVAA